MSDSQNQGSAGPALAAHSKDASAAGTTIASNAMSHESDRERQRAGARSNGPKVEPGQAARSGRVPGLPSRVSDQVAGFVRDRPISAIVGAAVLGIVAGLILAAR